MYKHEVIRAITTRTPRSIARSIVGRAPATWKNARVDIPYRGAMIRLYTGETVGRHIYFFNDYESEQIDTFLALVQEGMHVFDVGANIGVYSLTAAAKGARVTAFEPDKEIIDQFLSQSVGMNKANVRIINSAVSSTEGMIPFYAHRPGNFGVGSILSGDEARRVDVASNTLDSYVEKFGVPDLIKMDIEGAEWYALQGATKLLASPDAPLFFLELHPSSIVELGGSIAEVERIFLENGFRAFGIKKFVQGPIGNHDWVVFSKKAPSSENLVQIDELRHDVL